MTQPLTASVLAAMHPLVARATERDEIVQVEPSLWRRFPRIDVVNMERSTTRRCDAATKAGAAISRDSISTHALPRAGSVYALAIGTDPTAPSGVTFPRHAVHAVRFALKPRSRPRRRVGDELAALGRVLPTLPVRLISRLRPRVVTSMKVMPAWSGWDSKVPQLLVDSLGVSTHESRDLVGRKTLVLVLLTEPHGIKMRRLVCHATYRSPKNGGTP